MKGRRRSQRERTIQRILEATVEILSRGDLESLNLSRIARRAGVSKSLVLYYFHTKEELLFSAQHFFFEQILHRIRRTFPGTGIPEAFSAMDEVWESLRTLPPLFPLFVLFLKKLPTSRSRTPDLPQFFDELRNLIGQGIELFLGEENLKRLGVTREELRELLFLVFLGLTVFTPITRARAVSADAVYRTFKELLLTFVQQRGRYLPA